MNTGKYIFPTKVEVTEDDIKKGVQNLKACCPVALALRRVAWNPDSVRVDQDQLELDGKSYRTPSWVFRFVHDFDAFGAKAVHPIDFDLKIIR